MREPEDVFGSRILSLSHFRGFAFPTCETAKTRNREHARATECESQRGPLALACFCFILFFLLFIIFLFQICFHGLPLFTIIIYFLNMFCCSVVVLLLFCCCYCSGFSLLMTRTTRMTTAATTFSYALFLYIYIDNIWCHPYTPNTNPLCTFCTTGLTSAH